ncbi:MAG: HEAT repeat domain-containing protein [Planctomycetota bacterium]
MKYSANRWKVHVERILQGVSWILMIAAVVLWLGPVTAHGIQPAEPSENAPPPAPNPPAPENEPEPANPAEEMPATSERDAPAEGEMPTEPMEPAEEKPGPDGASAEKPGEPKDPRVEKILPDAGTDIQRMHDLPQTAEQFYRVIDRDLTFGRLDQAKAHLEQLLARPDFTPATALMLREKYGSSLPIKVSTHPELRELGEQLSKRFNDASRDQARNAERIQHFIENLAKSPNERSYALRQLRISGPYAIPYFIQAIESSGKNRPEYEAAMLELKPEVWPAVAAILDSGDPLLMNLAIDLLRQYAVPRAADFLWYYSASPQVPAGVRANALETLSYLTDKPVPLLPAASDALVAVADRYYRHRGNLGETTDLVPIWRWQDGQLTVTEESYTAAEQYFGLKAARQAVELDPENRKAAVLLVSTALEKSVEKSGIENLAPTLREGEVETVLSAGPALMSEVLAQAIRDGRSAVALGAVRALGEIGSADLVADHGGQVGALGRALNFPDPRVQFAAALAVLQIHPPKFFPHASRVVDTLIGAIDNESRPRAVVISESSIRGNELGTLLNEMGLAPAIGVGGRQGFKAAVAVGGLELILVEAGIQDWALDQTLANLRADARTAGVPVYVVAESTSRDAIERKVARYRRVYAIPPVDDKDKLLAAMDKVSSDWQAKPLTAEEVAARRKVAIEWLVRLSRGELPYMDIRPAARPLMDLLPVPDQGVYAAEALSYLPSAEVQDRLANAVLNETIPLPNRIAACNALAHNVQISSRSVSAAVASKLMTTLQQSEGGEFAVALARLLGALGPDEAQSAARILKLKPLTEADVEAAAPKNAAPPAPEEMPDEGSEKPAETKAPEEKAKGFFDNP